MTRLATPFFLSLVVALPAMAQPQLIVSLSSGDRASSNNGPQAPTATEADQVDDVRKIRIGGPTLSKNVRRLLSELRWHKKLRTAYTAAKRRGKPIVWVQALGDLKGYT